MLQACKALLQPGSSFTFNLSNILKEHPNYKLVFTGHSLGAGVAFVMAIILAGCQTDPSASQKEPTWVLHHPSFPTERGERPIQAVCFAPPNWCDPATATAVAKGHPSPLVTSVAIESDIVCRFCWPQVRLLKRTVVYLSDLPRDDLSGLLIGWLTKKLGLSSGTHLIERAWAIRKDLGHLARETEPDRWGPPGYLLHLARDDKSNASSQWQLYEVKDHQRLYGAICTPLFPLTFRMKMYLTVVV